MNDLHILFLGDTEADARDFIGFGPDHVPGEPAREDRPSQMVPDSVWPPEANAIGYFMGVDTFGKDQAKYDLLIVTPKASLLLDQGHPWVQEHVAQGGRVYRA